MKLFILVLKIVLISAVLVWAALKFDPAVARDTVRSSNPLLGALAIAFCAAGYHFIALRWKMILKGFWPALNISVFKLYWFNLLALFYNLFIPTSVAGEAVRVIQLGKETNKDYSKCLSSVVLDRLIGMILWLTIFLLSPSPFKNNKFWLILIIGLPVFYLLRNKIKLWEQAIFDFSRHHPADIVKGILFSLAGQFFFILSSYYVFRCFKIDISLTGATAVVATATMTGIVPVTFLGVSLREASFLGLLPGYGASATQSFMAVTLIVFLTYLFSLPAGIAELARTGWHISKLKIPETQKLPDTPTGNE